MKKHLLPTQYFFFIILGSLFLLPYTSTSAGSVLLESVHLLAIGGGVTGGGGDINQNTVYTLEPLLTHGSLNPLPSFRTGLSFPEGDSSGIFILDQTNTTNIDSLITKLVDQVDDTLTTGWVVHVNGGRVFGGGGFSKLESEWFGPIDNLVNSNIDYIRFIVNSIHLDSSYVGYQQARINYDLDATWEIWGTPALVPIPPSLYLFGSGLLGLIGVARKKAA